MATLDPKNFRQNVRDALSNEVLHRALRGVVESFPDRRQEVADALPEFDALRDKGREIKQHVMGHLDFYLERFERRVMENGGRVHWARTAEEARDIVLSLCRQYEATSVTKGKSMITEEIGLNGFLEENGVRPVETDLGEYIIQLRRETPSHIILPAAHLTQTEIEGTFRDKHRDLPAERSLEDPRALLEEAREKLRQRFVNADLGITGANFLVAETGSIVLVTNEGNGDLTMTLPRVHVAVTSIEKVVPTMEDASVFLRLLGRSGTGQELTAYTSFVTGPKRDGDLDGPDAFHIVLLDNGRSAMLGGDFEETLHCIRCGACFNHCPIYASIGGHAYGSVYAGPIGAALSPALNGLKETPHLADASTLCGRCEAVCPVRIPIPKMLRAWREREFNEGLYSTRSRLGLKLWAFAARRPGLYRRLTGLGMRALRLMGGRRRALKWLPLAGGWTRYRDLPAPEGKTFLAQWRKDGSGNGGRRKR